MVARTGVCSAALGVVLLAADAGADVLEQAKTVSFELGMETKAAPRQRSMERMMTGLALAMVGGRLVWYRFEDKDCPRARGDALRLGRRDGSRRAHSWRAADDRAGRHPDGTVRQLRTAARWRDGPRSHRLLMAAQRGVDSPQGCHR